MRKQKRISPVCAPRRGFTIIEMMVVVGIIVGLIAILLPALGKARERAKAVQISSNIRTIAVALVEYKNVNRGYLPPAGKYTGFATLGSALVGPGGAWGGRGGVNDPYPAAGKYGPSAPPFDAAKAYRAGDCVSFNMTAEYVAAIDTPAGNTPSGTSKYWKVFPFSDGKAGEGFVGADGKPVGPFISADKMKMRGEAILDGQDNPVLYFPCRAGKPNLHIRGGQSPGSAGGGFSPFVDQSDLSLVNADHNLQFFVWVNAGEDYTTTGDQKKGLNRIRAFLGDTDCSGHLNGSEEVIGDQEYILWSAGPDGIFGPKLDPGTGIPSASDLRKCDDITNLK